MCEEVRLLIQAVIGASSGLAERFGGTKDRGLQAAKSPLSLTLVLEVGLPVVYDHTGYIASPLDLPVQSSSDVQTMGRTMDRAPTKKRSAPCSEVEPPDHDRVLFLFVQPGFSFLLWSIKGKPVVSGPLSCYVLVRCCRSVWFPAWFALGNRVRRCGFGSDLAPCHCNRIIHRRELGRRSRGKDFH